MPTTLTIDIFSGRRNPEILLEGSEERELLERLRPEKDAEPGAADPFSETFLGYRGIQVRIEGERPDDLPASFRVVNGLGLADERPPFRIADTEFEQFLCSQEGPMGPLFRAQADLPALLLEERERWRKAWDSWMPAESQTDAPPLPSCPSAPPYEPHVWNTGKALVQNNCYSYATNMRTVWEGEPGCGVGEPAGTYTPASVRDAALRDGLVRVASHNVCPPEGHLVALFLSAGDYHWCRKDRDGYWSHKMNLNPASNLDNSGRLIADPFDADFGGFTIPGGFMTVKYGHVCVREACTY